MPYDLKDPAYFDVAATGKELARVTELCDGCRRCHRLCASFDYMLDEAVDKNDGDLARITSGDYRKIVDLCWQCKLCYNHCPYTPPHKWSIDFPRLLLRAKAARAKAEGVTRQDAWLGNPDAVGGLGCATAPLSNWANGFGPARAVLQAVVGIDKTRRLPRFHRKTFARWFRERPGGEAAEGRPVALFFSCLVNYNEPQLGRDTVSVLERNGCRVSCPEQVCCGMPYLDGGDVEAAARNAERNVRALLPLVEQGALVVVPQPTCSYVLKKDYPMLAPGAATEKVAAATRDLFEYLAGRHKEGSLVTDFPGRKPGRIAYQMPCHLRAQNMGFKTREVMELIPGTDVHTIESCTAMDGTWGMKREFFPRSLHYARRVAHKMEAAKPETFMTDCSLSALQIEEARGERPAHPVTILREAYGLPPGTVTMRRIEIKDLKNIAEYEKVREAMRADVIALKQRRRVHAGENLTLLFENRQTVLFQIQEMMRAERIVHDGKVQDEIDAYDGLLPGEGELAATLFIEIPDLFKMTQEEIRRTVNRFQGLDKGGVALEVGGERVPARFEGGHGQEERMAAVHYLRFPVSDRARAALADASAKARLVVDHPHYKAEAELTPPLRRELLFDLSG